MNSNRPETHNLSEILHDRILIGVPQANELQPLLQRFQQLGHQAQAVEFGKMPCFSIPSLGMIAFVGGHGKTQFAIQCQYLIDRCDGVTALFCVGAAGSLTGSCRSGDLVIGECTVEHDYKIRFEPSTAPSHPGSQALTEELHQATAAGTFSFGTHVGRIASGDEDIVDQARAREIQQLTGAICVAWEGSGGARAATFNQLSFVEIRCITDGADADAAASFRANCERALPNAADLIVRWRANVRDSQTKTSALPAFLHE